MMTDTEEKTNDEEIDVPVQEEQTRAELVSHLIIFQLKLVFDGARDALLIPVSFIAAIYGLFFNKEDPWSWYREVLIWGRASDHWIDLFDAHKNEASPDFEILAKQTRDRMDADMKAYKARKKTTTGETEKE